MTLTHTVHTVVRANRGEHIPVTLEWSGRLGLASRAMEGLVPIMLSEKGRWRERRERETEIKC